MKLYLFNEDNEKCVMECKTHEIKTKCLEDNIKGIYHIQTELIVLPNNYADVKRFIGVYECNVVCYETELTMFQPVTYFNDEKGIITFNKIKTYNF